MSRKPSHPDPEIALALDWWRAEEEDRDRMILGLYHRPGQKPRRGRPPRNAGDPAAIFAKIEGKPFSELSKAQRDFALRIGVDLVERGWSPRFRSAVLASIERAHKDLHPLAGTARRPSAFDVAAEKHGISAGAARMIWQRYGKRRI